MLLVVNCQSKITELDIKNRDLSLSNGVMLFKEKPYSGLLYSKIDTLIIHRVTYLEGKKHGREERFYYDGKKASQRFFSEGKKVGFHRGWWNNKQPKFQNQFDFEGNFSGIQREWLSNGLLIKEFNFVKGKEDGWQKTWDVNGKITSNYFVVNGERFGLIGYEKCKSNDYVD